MNTTAKVLIQQRETDTFPIYSGVKQGDTLSTVVFNLMLHYAIRDHARTGSLLSRSGMTIAYADDIAIVARNTRYMEELFTNIEKSAKEVGLNINENKTKYMKMSTNVNRRQIQNIKIGDYNFEGVSSFVYLGALLKNDNSMQDGISDRLAAANRAFFAHKKIFTSRLISKSCKLSVYKTIIRPTATYGCETWSMTASDQQRLRVFERKILRKIFGPTRDINGDYVQRCNDELLEICQGEDVVKYIKAQRLSWAGHVARMDNSRPQKTMLNHDVRFCRRRGRPRTRWKDCVEDDLKILGIRNWQQTAENREEWRKITDQAKAHPEL